MEVEFYLEVVFTHVFEWNAELLDPTDLFHAYWDHLLLRNSTVVLTLLTICGVHLVEFGFDGLMADQFGDLNLTGKENLHPLGLGSLTAILQEVLHAAVELGFEELLEGVRNSKLLISVSEKANVDD